LALPELLRGPRTIKGLRSTNLTLLFMMGNPLMNDAINVFFANHLKYQGWFAPFWPDRLSDRASQNGVNQP